MEDIGTVEEAAEAGWSLVERIGHGEWVWGWARVTTNADRASSSAASRRWWMADRLMRERVFT